MDRKQQHTRDLLRRWISGDITASEERELRQAAREDELLGEALAGYEQQAEADHAGSMKRLRSQLPTQGQARVRPLVMWRVAAAVLLLVAVSWWVLTPQFENAAAPDIAADQAERPTATEEAFAEAVEPAPLESAPPEAPVRAREELSEPAPTGGGFVSESEIAARLEEETVFDSAPVEDVPETFEDTALALESEPERAEEAARVVAADTATPEPTEDADIVAAPAPAPPPAPASPTYDSPLQNQGYPSRLDDRTLTLNSGAPVAQQGFRIIEGKVLDNEGYPLIGAAVIENGTSNGTVTDFDGYYRLTIPEAGATLSVNYTGYNNQQVTVGEESEVDIVLEEGMVLDEVVVTGLGENRRQKRVADASTAAPEEGYRALKRYIDAQTPVNTPRSRIRLQFTLQADGRLTNFQVLSSTNAGLNNFAIELLQNGPAWQVTEGNAPVTILYTVKLKG